MKNSPFLKKSAKVVLAFLLFIFHFSFVQAQLSGTYTIDSSKAASATNFKTFTAAVDTLNNDGVSGPVVFNVADGVYYEGIDLEYGIKGVDSANSITFQSASGDSSKVIIEYSLDSSPQFNTATDGPLVYIFSISFITFKGLTFERTGNGYQDCFFQLDAASFITIDNCVFLLPGKFNSYYYATIQVDLGSYANNLIIRNNANISISNANCQNVLIANNYCYSMFLERGNNYTIKDNTIIYSGIFSAFSSNFIIDNNTIIRRKDSTQFAALFLLSDSSFSVKNNRIMSAYGGIEIDDLGNGGHCYGISDDNILVYPVLNPKITRHGDTLVSSFAAKNQWYYNHNAIDTSSSIIIHKNGIYTLTQTNDGGCSSTDSFILYDTLRGTITTSKGAVLKNQWVYELVYNAHDSVLSAVDSIKTDTGGHYVFYTNDTAVYLVAVPDSANYPNEMPTYYDSALTFQSASIIHPKLGTTVINFSTIGGTNSSGGSFIGGTVTICNCKKPGKGQPVPNLRVILVDNNNNPVRQTHTDKYGAFAFGSLAKGTYKIWVDYPHLDNSLAPVINLPANTSIKKDLLFILYPTYLQLDTTTTSVDQIASFATNLTVYPNPFSSTITISYTLPANQNVLLTLTDITGKQIATLADETQNPGQHIYTLDAEKYNIPAGMYFLQMVAGNEAVEQKIVRIR